MAPDKIARCKLGGTVRIGPAARQQDPIRQLNAKGQAMTNLLQRYDFLLFPCRDNASPDESHWHAALSYITRVGNAANLRLWPAGLVQFGAFVRTLNA
jgi:hypothetical protein